MNTLSIFLMSPPAGQSGGGFTQLLPFLLIFVVIYFFMIRPQSKKTKEQSAFRNQLEKGTRIVTIGGIHGKIIEVQETTLIIEVEGNSRLKIEKQAISPDYTKVSYPPAKTEA